MKRLTVGQGITKPEHTLPAKTLDEAVGMIASRECKSDRTIYSRYYEGKKTIEANANNFLKYMIDNYLPKDEK